uniref:Uncharacterized protein n=1 Tax=viral metagenome TaxID=1070528 RepID=A0A6C0CNS4_9ZZZZ
MENLNLNIDTYSLNDLINLFSLDKSFTQNAVQDGKGKLHNQLKKVSYLGAEKKREIGLFIDSAASKLLNMSGKKDENQGTWSQQYNDMASFESHYIIDNPNTQEGKKAKQTDGRIAGEESFPAGYLNPINVKTTVTTMNLDTRFRDNYDRTRSSDFTVHLPQKQNKVVTLRIGTLDIPASWYSISRTRGNANFLILDRTQGDTINVGDLVLDYHDLTDIEAVAATETFWGNYAWLVTLPDGNYELEYQGESNGEPIATALNAAIAESVPGYFFDGRFYGKNTPTTTDYLTEYDIQYSIGRANGRSIFSPKTPDASGSASYLLDGFITDFNVDQRGYSVSDNIQLRLGWQLGFRSERRETDTASGITSITSNGICLPCGPRYFFISIDDGQKNAGNSFIAAFKNSTLDRNIMSRINASALMDDVGVFKSSSDPGLSNQLNRTREYFGPVDIERLQISLIDEYGRKLDLNNMDWSMTLVFEHLYD